MLQSATAGYGVHRAKKALFSYKRSDATRPLHGSQTQGFSMDIQLLSQRNDCYQI
jgi:hypothetical protein